MEELEQRKRYYSTIINRSLIVFVIFIIATIIMVIVSPHEKTYLIIILSFLGIIIVSLVTMVYSIFKFSCVVDEKNKLRNDEGYTRYETYATYVNRDVNQQTAVDNIL